MRSGNGRRSSFSEPPRRRPISSEIDGGFRLRADVGRSHLLDRALCNAPGIVSGHRFACRFSLRRSAGSRNTRRDYGGSRLGRNRSHRGGDGPDRSPALSLGRGLLGRLRRPGLGHRNRGRLDGRQRHVPPPHTDPGLWNLLRPSLRARLVNRFIAELARRNGWRRLRTLLLRHRDRSAILQNRGIYCGRGRWRRPRRDWRGLFLRADRRHRRRRGLAGRRRGVRCQQGLVHPGSFGSRDRGLRGR